MFKIKKGHFIGGLLHSMGWSNTDVAEKTGVSRHAIQKYVGMQDSAISQDKQKILAKMAGLDEGFIDAGKYPFGENRFWKLFISERPFSNIEPFYTILRMMGTATVIDLRPRLSGFKKNVEQRFYSEPPYALIVKDMKENMFILRKKDPEDFITWPFHEKNPITRIVEFAKEDDQLMTIMHGSLPIGDDLYRKIKTTWENVGRRDIEPLFDEARTKLKITSTTFDENLSAAERHMIEYLRERQISPYDVLKAIQG